MMMSLLDPGLLVLMSYMLMRGSFVAHLGHQVSLILSPTFVLNINVCSCI